jgi:hypothetical protein
LKETSQRLLELLTPMVTSSVNPEESEFTETIYPISAPSFSTDMLIVEEKHPQVSTPAQNKTQLSVFFE